MSFFDETNDKYEPILVCCKICSCKSSSDNIRARGFSCKYQNKSVTFFTLPICNSCSQRILDCPHNYSNRVEFTCGTENLFVSKVSIICYSCLSKSLDNNTKQQLQSIM